MCIGVPGQIRTIDGNQATVLITEPGDPQLLSLQFSLNNQGWTLVQ